MIKYYKVRDIAEAQNFLNGALLSGKRADAGLPLVGKTMTFTAPAAATCTFTAAGVTDREPTLLLLKDIKAQLEAQVAGLKVYEKDGILILIETTPSAGINLTGGTALPLLGMTAKQTKVYTSGLITAPPVKPYLITCYAQNDNSHILVVDE
jgi:hypothetical protein